MNGQAVRLPLKKSQSLGSFRVNGSQRSVRVMAEEREEQCARRCVLVSVTEEQQEYI